MLRQKWSRSQVDARLANMPPCLIGMEACVGAHHLGRQLKVLGHDARLMPAKHVRPYSKGQKNDSVMQRRLQRRCSVHKRTHAPQQSQDYSITRVEFPFGIFNFAFTLRMGNSTSQRSPSGANARSTAPPSSRGMRPRMRLVP